MKTLADAGENEEAEALTKQVNDDVHDVSDWLIATPILGILMAMQADYGFHEHASASMQTIQVPCSAQSLDNIESVIKEGSQRGTSSKTAFASCV